MFIRVNPSSSTPIYNQVVDQVKHAVAAGRLKTGDQLPSVRELAIELRINPNTVAKAYRELEQGGVVLARQGSGGFIADRPPTISKTERLKIAEQHVDQAIVQSMSLALEGKEIKDLFLERLEKFNGPRARAKGGES